MPAKKRPKPLTGKGVLRRYKDEALPAFVGMALKDVNQVGNFDERPLHAACSRGAMEEVRALVEAGADVNAPGELGHTPLHEAVSQNHFEVLKYLLAHGASTEKKNEFGQTALDLAKLNKNRMLIKRLKG
jgi:uncharacterized protein